MLKFLVIVAFLIGSSFFLTDAFALEVEIQKESDRIIDSMGWLRPDKISYQEQIQIVIDHANKQNRITVGMLSVDPNDIRFPDELENIVNEPRIISLIVTNQFACAPTKMDRACVIVDIERDGLGKNITEIREKTRLVTDEFVADGVLFAATEFVSVTLHPRMNESGEQEFVSRALYTINKQQTHDLFLALSTLLLSGEIRNSGGFYNNAEELAKHPFAAFSIALTPQENKTLRTLQITLACSDTKMELADCPKNTSEQIELGNISPLDFFSVENLERSKIFEDEFLPLNSIIQVIIFSNDDLQVKDVNSPIIERLQDLSDVQESGWFFTKSDGKIDGRFLFAGEPSISKNDVSFSIGPNSGNAIEVNDGGGCLIATTAFGSELTSQVQL